MEEQPKASSSRVKELSYIIVQDLIICTLRQVDSYYENSFKEIFYPIITQAPWLIIEVKDNLEEFAETLPSEDSLARKIKMIRGRIEQDYVN